MRTAAFIAVVDDDESVRESLDGLLESIGYAVESFASAEDLLGSDHLSEMDCLILDVRMPRMSGPELQKELARLGHEPPIVYISSYSFDDVRRRVPFEARVAYLLKPFDEEALLRAIDQFLPAR